MNIEAEKNELLKLILETESEEVIQEIKGVFKRQEIYFGMICLMLLKKVSIVV